MKKKEIGKNVTKGILSLGGGLCTSYTVGRLIGAIIPKTGINVASIAVSIGSALIGSVVTTKVCQTIEAHVDDAFDAFEEISDKDIMRDSFERIVEEGEA